MDGGGGEAQRIGFAGRTKRAFFCREDEYTRVTQKKSLHELGVRVRVTSVARRTSRTLYAVLKSGRLNSSNYAK